MYWPEKAQTEGNFLQQPLQYAFIENYISGSPCICIHISDNYLEKSNNKCKNAVNKHSVFQKWAFGNKDGMNEMLFTDISTRI